MNVLAFKLYRRDGRDSTLDVWAGARCVASVGRFMERGWPYFIWVYYPNHRHNRYGYAGSVAEALDALGRIVPAAERSEPSDEEVAARLAADPAGIRTTFPTWPPAEIVTEDPALVERIARRRAGNRLGQAA